MKLFKTLVATLLLSGSAMTFADSTAELTVDQYWAGTGSYDRIFVTGNTSLIGGDCSYERWFAIKTDDPNYKGLRKLVQMAIANDMVLKVYGPGTECLNSGKFPVVNRITLIK
jgi:hypothetical protein